MSNSDLEKFPGGTQDKGVNNFEPDIGAEITWDEDAVNMTTGIRRGVGPRYGMAPLPGQIYDAAPSGTQTNNFSYTSGTTASRILTGFADRGLFYKLIPLNMRTLTATGDDKPEQYYVWILTKTTGESIDAAISSTVSGGIFTQNSNLRAGLSQNSYSTLSGFTFYKLHKTELLNLPVGATSTNMAVILYNGTTGLYPYDYSTTFMPYCHVSVVGKRVPYFWMFCDTTTTPDATTAPNLNLWSKTASVGLNPVIQGGSPSEIITRVADPYLKRTLSVYCLDDDAFPISLYYNLQITKSNTAAVTGYGTGDNYTALTGATKTGSSTGYSTVQSACIYDPGSFTNSKHDAILLGGNFPRAIIYQNWLIAPNGMMPRWVDMSRPGCMPRDSVANIIGDASAFFDPTQLTQAVDGGILRNNTSYDFGFSYYNKLIDYETNVAFGKTESITADLSVMDIATSGATSAYSPWQLMQSSGNAHLMPWEYSASGAYSGGEDPRGMHVNDYEIRFYYRETGTAEWLPAGNVDAAKLWFYPWGLQNQHFRICKTPVGGLIGGRPNGFIDYSPLPRQPYICVTHFSNRAFWWSDSTMYFSALNNIYAYPTGNSVVVPSGKWRGGIVHIRNNEVDQTARLVCFGDDTFVARFTGEKSSANVRISSTEVGQFEVDGSDFQINFLCDATAWSYRSAVVAEGILYFWGPQGIFRDDGTTTPIKISLPLEPDIFSFTDGIDTKRIHSIYNKATSEVIWFYPQAGNPLNIALNDQKTFGLIFNIENGRFYYAEWNARFDDSQLITVESDETTADIQGQRTIVNARNPTNSLFSTPFFLDSKCEAGDLNNQKMIYVTAISTPIAGRRTLTVDGISGLTSKVAINDLISFNQTLAYAPSLTTATDMIAKVVSVSAGTIVIELPDGGDIDGTATLNTQNGFPIWHKAATGVGQNGITYAMPTNYWLPDGLSNSWFWLFLNFLFKYEGIPTPTNAFTGRPVGAEIDLAYRTLVCSGTQQDTRPLRLTNNSDGHCQILRPLQNIGRSANGQALKYALSGIHIGNPWTLEYLEAYCKKETGFTLKEFFEG